MATLDTALALGLRLRKQAGLADKLPWTFAVLQRLKSAPGKIGWWKGLNIAGGLAGAGTSEAVIRHGLPGVGGGQAATRDTELDERTKQLKQQAADLAYWQNPSDPQQHAKGKALVEQLGPELERRAAAYRGQLSEPEAKRQALQDMQQWMEHRKLRQQFNPANIAKSYLAENPSASKEEVQTYADKFTKIPYRDTLRNSLDDLKKQLARRVEKNRSPLSVPEDLGIGGHLASAAGWAASATPAYWTSAWPKNKAKVDVLVPYLLRAATSGTGKAVPLVWPRVTHTAQNVADVSEQAYESGASLSDAAKQLQAVGEGIKEALPSIRRVASRGIGANVKVDLVSPEARERLKRWMPALAVGGTTLGAGGAYLLYQAAKARAKERKVEMKALREQTKLQQLQRKALTEGESASVATAAD